jgi:hypothetical protein
VDWIGLDLDEVVWIVYQICMGLWEMWHIFDKMVDRDVVSWTTTIGR